MKDNLRIAFEKVNELDGVIMPSVMELTSKGWKLEICTVNYRSSQDNDYLITETFSVLCKGFYKDGMPRMGYCNKKAPTKYHTSCDDSFNCSCLSHEVTERYVGDGQFHDGFENVSRF